MRIWRGLGFIVPLVYFTMIFGMHQLTGSYFRDTSYYFTQPWGVLWTGALSAILIFGASVVGDVRGSQKALRVDGGESVQAVAVDSFLMLPLVWWALISLGAGAAFAGVISLIN